MSSASGALAVILFMTICTPIYQHRLTTAPDPMWRHLMHACILGYDITYVLSSSTLSSPHFCMAWLVALNFLGCQQAKQSNNVCSPKIYVLMHMPFLKVQLPAYVNWMMTFFNVQEQSRINSTHICQVLIAAVLRVLSQQASTHRSDQTHRFTATHVTCHKQHLPRKRLWQQSL